MSSTDPFQNQESAQYSQSNSSRWHRIPAWMLPAFLVAAFGAILLWFMRDRLLPSQRVTVASVVLLSDLEGGDVGGAPNTATTKPAATAQDSEAEFAASMRFQAAGWFEPDPLPIRATALVDGVIESVHVLEGETVKKGQKLASLIAEDVELQLSASRRMLEEIVAEHHMHLATISGESESGERVRSDQCCQGEARGAGGSRQTHPQPGAGHGVRTRRDSRAAGGRIAEGRG